MIVNGPLNMSAGKIAAQVFQAAQRLFTRANPEQAERLRLWQERGTCTRVRIAQSPAVFERACRELDGVAMVDEGMNEVEPDTTTCFATYPINDAEELPRILRHKRVPVLNAQVEHVSTDRPKHATEAELAQHRHKAEGTTSAQVLAQGETEVVGSNPAGGSGPSGPLTSGAAKAASGDHAREAELAQHRQADSSANAEVAGSKPAASFPGRPSKGVWEPRGGEGQTSSPLQGARDTGVANAEPNKDDVVANASHRRPLVRFDSSTPRWPSGHPAQDVGDGTLGTTPTVS